MARLPTVICTSVVRSAHQGQSHGGVYLVDLETEQICQVVDWNDGSISFEGRGLDRGLRGIAFWGGDVWIAASDELIRYDQAFRIKASYRNAYFRHCHEIAVAGDQLFLTSTGFDSVLTFDLVRERFTAGLLVRVRDARNARARFDFRRFDPEVRAGPAAGDTIHINNVVPADGGFVFSALRLPVLLDARGGGVRPDRPLPAGSHNARPLANGALLNDTASSRLARTDHQAGSTSRSRCRPTIRPSSRTPTSARTTRGRASTAGSPFWTMAWTWSRSAARPPTCRSSPWHDAVA